MDKNETLSVFLMITLLAFAVVLVDERLLRTAVAVLPALMLAQKALRPVQVQEPLTGAAANRRQDDEVRGYIEQLLKYFREFYTTCHLMSVNVLTVEAAEERAANLERDLNKLLAQVTEAARKGGAQPKR
ncbi:MAG: hypothetical protein Q8N53_05555 [Longimicrobiales bacterium]|nr:hypothetical protein [Longimicrobiales bacterium]